MQEYTMLSNPQGGGGGLGLQDLTHHNHYTNIFQHHNKSHANVYEAIQLPFIPLGLLYYTHHVGRRMVRTIATWRRLNIPFQYVKSTFILDAHITFGLPWLVERLFDNDTRLAKPVTNNLVIDTACHGKFCTLCNDCHVYNQTLPNVHANLARPGFVALMYSHSSLQMR